MLGLLRKIFGTANDRIIKKLRQEVENINRLEDYYTYLSDEEIKNCTQEFKEKVASKKATLDDLLYDSFALVREASKRVFDKRHFDEQLIGGIILHRGMIAEMGTGEGKTLTSTLPAYLNSLSGKGVHVVTVNDYLAKRDAEWMEPLFEFLGLSVGYIVPGLSDIERKMAYDCDITYATNNELGFDYLRDNMKFSIEAKAQRAFNYAIIDEVDSILIDEARTPLIISGPSSNKLELYLEINQVVKQLEPEHYDKDEKSKSATLNEAGIIKVEELLIQAGLITNQNDTSLYDIENAHLVQFISQALKAHVMFKIEVDYIVTDGQLLIIDEFTGRIMEGRRYSEGLHQALEAKEGLEVRNENQTLASITFQNYFRLYPKFAGMTGTALTESAEFKFIYNLDVISVPAHRKVQRIDHDDEIYGSSQEKYQAVLKTVKEAHEKGQPVLVGTTSIEKSEILSRLFTESNIPHKVLNAKYHEQEAHIISQAGRFKAVTIATNMAGRGTDITLGGNAEMLIENLSIQEETELQKAIELIFATVAEEKEKVSNAGGLFIIGTERHESRRIDNQLRGRSGRQGDPGASKFFLSLEDDLMRIFASDKIAGLLRNMGLNNGEAIQHSMISKALEKAQQRVESHNYEIRKNLLKFDDIMNEQRKIVYSNRDDIIGAQNLLQTILEKSNEWSEELVKKYIPEGTFREEWQLEELSKEVERILNIKINPEQLLKNDLSEEDLAKSIKSASQELLTNKQTAWGEKLFNEASAYIILNLLDQGWKDHLYALDHLRHGINLRAYGQKDPFIEYKREALVLFEKMLDHFIVNMIAAISHLHLSQETDVAKTIAKEKQQRQMEETRLDPAFERYNTGAVIQTKLKSFQSYIKPEERDPSNPESWGKISRNELCPCESGQKYKQCHGKI